MAALVPLRQRQRGCRSWDHGVIFFALGVAHEEGHPSDAVGAFLRKPSKQSQTKTVLMNGEPFYRYNVQLIFLGLFHTIYMCDDCNEHEFIQCHT